MKKVIKFNAHDYINCRNKRSNKTDVNKIILLTI